MNTEKSDLEALDDLAELFEPLSDEPEPTDEGGAFWDATMKNARAWS